MANIPSTLLQEMRQFRQDQESLARDYEALNNNEMHYLVRWSLLEGFVKMLAAQYRRTMLMEALKSWISYLENEKKVENFAIKTVFLPRMEAYINTRKSYHQTL